jgi:hypothetical protein
MAKKNSRTKTATDAAEKAADTPRPAATTESPSEEAIRERAYQRYLERGGGHGLDFEDWLEAERELRKGQIDRVR